MAVTNPAETYEQFMVPALFQPWATSLVRLADPKLGERVLDVGCGTGIVARLVAPAVGGHGTVVGIDINPDMINVARSAAVDEGLAIEWLQGKAENLPFPDRDVDLALCQFALMFFDDRRAALAEVRRVLRDGGRVVISVWQGLGHHPFYATLHEAIQRRLGISGVGAIFALGDVEELRSLLAGAGFRDIEILPASMTARFPAPDQFLAGEIDVDTAAIPAMQRLGPNQREEIVAAIRDDMAEALREVTESDDVALTFHANFALAHR